MTNSLLLHTHLPTHAPTHAPTHSLTQAHWGAAMSYSHPVWDFITDERLALAATRSQQATACTLTHSLITERERAYVQSLAVYTNLTDAAVQEPAERLRVYAEDFLERVYLPYGATDPNAG
jgi:hypothetical protein